LLRLIPAIERPTQGAVVVNGQNVSALKRAAVPFLRRNLGMIFQDQKLLFDRSAFDNVMLPLAIAGVATRDAGRRVRAALDKVGLLDREKAMPIALSGGEQQRLAIARAVVARPSILIADEPTAHLDDDTARDIAAMFHSFNQVGVTVLVATHHEMLFAPYMTRRVSLSHGRIAP
jgi:cell division transport system ATP-binding protein